MSSQGEHSVGSSIGLGSIWNRLEEERQLLCEAMVHPGQASLDLMQTRLSELDGALDRVSSGTYGYCKHCGETLEEARLEQDAAICACSVCANLSGEAGENQIECADGLDITRQLAFDVVHVQTSHSSYRFLLTDPATGRSFVDGGKYFSEPTEATILGSSTRNAAFRSGWVGIGFRLELWAADQLISTSAVKAVRVEHSVPEAVSEVTALYR